MSSSKRFPGVPWAASLALAAGLSLPVSSAVAAATIVINNINVAGVGFNDTTAAVPVGGNPGTTLGQQRLFAFTYAANIWGATVTSSVPIVINAQFTPLTCTATSAVLGSAGATEVFADFPGAIRPGTLYSFALANKLAGEDLDPGFAQINARFNSNLGLAGCLTGTPFYLGVDNNAGPSRVDFVETLLHEMGHGLGFQTFTNGSTGAQFAGYPSIWDHFLHDDSTDKLWVNMTDAERAASAINARKLSWSGAIVTQSAPQVLSFGTPTFQISGPAAGNATGTYPIGTASFGAPLSATAVTGQLMPVVDQSNGTGLACTTLSAANATAVRGNIALVDRGVCGFTVKAKVVQDAGAIAVVVVDNVVDSPPPDLGGTDPAVTIPAVRISLVDGTAIRAKLNRRSRTASGVVVTIFLNTSQLAGANAFGNVLMYTPNPYRAGSSVSHWDTSARRNLLMEPAINVDLTQSVVPPDDLTFPLLRDTGW